MTNIVKQNGKVYKYHKYQIPTDHKLQKKASKEMDKLGVKPSQFLLMLLTFYFDGGQ